MKSLRRFVAALGCAFVTCLAVQAQQEGPVDTQALVNVDARSVAPASASAVTVAVNNRKEPLSDWRPIAPANAQIALLIDDGLRVTVGRELNTLRTFLAKLPPGVEVMVGFMQNGRIVTDQGFTADHRLAASALRLPSGIAGTSGSPYLCLSEFVKHWPGGEASSSNGPAAGGAHKARFVLMISDGVDPYNGSTSMMNQDSPYVTAAGTDAQRAGVAVYAIYFADAGLRGGSADSSGQNYLSQITEQTGGVSLWQGTGNPVSMEPFLEQFIHAISETYVATFAAPVGRDARKDLVQVKFSATKTKLHSADEVRPGNQE